MSEKMKNIPRLRFPEFVDSGEWEEKKISEVCEKPYSGGTPSSTNKEYYGGNIPFIRSAEIDKEKTELFLTDEGLKNSSAKLVKKGDVLVALYGANSGDVAISKIDGAINQAILCLNSKDSNSFLYQYLVLKKDWIVTKYIQGGQGNLSGEIIKSIELKVPSMKEQQKIADCLSSVDSLISAQSKKVELLKEHKKGLLQNLFPSEGESVPRLRFPEFVNNGEWEEDILNNVANFRRGSFPQPYGLPEWYDEINGMPFIQVFDVGDNLKLKATTKSKISKLGAKQSVFIPQGTLIITIQGSIGRVAITQYDAYIDRTLLLFEKFLRAIEKLFFAYVMQNLFEIEKEKAPGGIIKTITKEVLSDFKIKLPSFNEQQKIADCLSSLDEQISRQANKLQTLKEHKKGLMQQLFPSAKES